MKRILLLISIAALVAMNLSAQTLLSRKNTTTKMIHPSDSLWIGGGYLGTNADSAIIVYNGKILVGRFITLLNPDSSEAGLITLNGVSASVQYFAIDSTNNTWKIDSTGGTHTIHFPGGRIDFLDKAQTITGRKTYSDTIQGNISGNAGTATNGLVSTSSYSNPSWLTALAQSKVTGLSDSIAVLVHTAESYANPSWITSLAQSKVTGLPDSIAVLVHTAQSYANPTWLASLAWSKISSTPTTRAGYGITDVPKTDGTDATGTWSIGISGNAGTVTNGLYNTGTYSNPSWLTSLAWSKLTGTPTTRAGYGITDVPTTTGTDASGTWSIGISGNAGTVTNGLYNTGSYSNPSWLTSLAYSKITGLSDTLAVLVHTGESYTNPSWLVSIPQSKVTALSDTFAILLHSAHSYSNPSWLTALAFSKITGLSDTITNLAHVSETYSNPSWISALALSKVTGLQDSLNNRVRTSQSYSNPSWITSLAWSKITSTPTTRDNYGITDVPKTDGTDASGTWGISISGNAATATNGVVTSGSYPNPAWITALGLTKVTGLQDSLANTAHITQTYSNPSWISALALSKVTGLQDSLDDRARTSNSYSNPSWISALALAKITGAGTMAAADSTIFLANLPFLRGNALTYLTHTADTITFGTHTKINPGGTYELTPPAGSTTIFSITNYSTAVSMGAAFDISNRVGASTAAVIHNYSNVGPAVMQIDNTSRDGTIVGILRLKNASNASLHDGYYGQVPFIRCDNDSLGIVAFALGRLGDISIGRYNYETSLIEMTNTVRRPYFVYGYNSSAQTMFYEDSSGNSYNAGTGTYLKSITGYSFIPSGRLMSSTTPTAQSGRVIGYQSYKVSDNDSINLFGTGLASPGGNFVGIVRLVVMDTLGVPVAGDTANFGEYYVQVSSDANSSQIKAILAGANIETLEAAGGDIPNMNQITDGKVGLVVGDGSSAKRCIRVFNRLGSKRGVYVQISSFVDVSQF